MSGLANGCNNCTDRYGNRIQQGMRHNKSSGRLGHPRSFDTDPALDRALQVFWRKGYEGATLPELTKAMGVNRPSLYAAFGSKEELFRKALDRYAEHKGCFIEEALKEPKARTVTERLLASA